MTAGKACGIAMHTRSLASSQDSDGDLTKHELLWGHVKRVDVVHGQAQKSMLRHALPMQMWLH